MKQVSFLPRRSLLILYHSLVQLRLRYCNTVWGSCGNRLKTIIQQLQNQTAARIVTRTKYGAVEPEILLKEIGLLNVQQLIDVETAVKVHKSLNDSARNYLTNLFTRAKSVHSHNTRSANYGIFLVHADLKFEQRNFSHYGCKV